MIDYRLDFWPAENIALGCASRLNGFLEILRIGCLMSLNKKQKKQLDVEHKKLKQLQLQLAGAKSQLDDPEEVARLEKEIAATNGRLEKLKQSDG
jgi:hypothetical protein